jgi:tetratricopeptide (TPR) repeat protein
VAGAEAVLAAIMNGKATKQGSLSTEGGREPLRDRLGVSEQEFRAMGQMGAMYYQQGVLDKAQAIFEGLVEIDPTSAAAHSALGALFTRVERFDDALVHLDRAVALDPGQIAPYVNRAEIYIKQGRAEEAVVNLKQAIALDPLEKDPAANRARAMALGIAEALKSSGVRNQSSVS